MGVNTADAFEKDELAERLVQARMEGKTAEPEPAGPPPEEASASGDDGSVPADILARCQAMKASELRTELGSRGISWADALEKEELVQRLAPILAEEASFSHSGALRPGVVGHLSAVQLVQELETPSPTPLLLDVYATWCGPCQMMAPELEALARSQGAALRVAKMDSDQEPGMSTDLRVGGLPTVIVFDRFGNEVARQEGALMQQQLLELVTRSTG